MVGAILPREFLETRHSHPKAVPTLQAAGEGEARDWCPVHKVKDVEGANDSALRRAANRGFVPERRTKIHVDPTVINK